MHKLVLSGIQKYSKYELVGDTYEANANRIEANIYRHQTSIDN
jgi:hypothetical protein|tara:strand:+ start:729 stop:857 length:129 start_codon:yes stop_codon:yes gene_type:complete